MKRLTCILTTLLILLAALSSAGAESMIRASVIDETSDSFLDLYEAKVTYALETFGFDADLAYPYMPTHIDPVCYTGYISLIAGFKNGESYASYGGYSEADIQDYLGYLQYWGYQVSEHECALPDIREWHAVCPSPRSDGKGLIENVRIYYSPEWEMLTIVCPYLDGFLYQAWSESTFYPYGLSRQDGSVPFDMPPEAGCTVTIEEISYIEELEILSASEPDTSPYSHLRRDSDLLSIQKPECGSENVWEMKVRNRRNDQRLSMLCLQLSFDEPVDLQFLNKMCIASADLNSESSHFANVPMLYACEEDGMFSIWTEETKSSRVSVFFPPRYYDAHEGRRIYIRMKDPADPWIGDLREWCYVDLYPPVVIEPDHFIMPEETDDVWSSWTWN